MTGAANIGNFLLECTSQEHMYGSLALLRRSLRNLNLARVLSLALGLGLQGSRVRRLLESLPLLLKSLSTLHRLIVFGIPEGTVGVKHCLLKLHIQLFLNVGVLYG